MSWMQKELEEGESGTQEESIYYYSESVKQWVLIDAMDFEHLLRTMKKLVRGAVRNHLEHRRMRSSKWSTKLSKPQPRWITTQFHHLFSEELCWQRS
mgnify:CR=1 FL=1